MNKPTSQEKQSSVQTGSRRDFDVVVIGAGIAGLFYAIELLEKRPQLKVALISKGPPGEGNSRYAQGGLAAVVGNEDSAQAHLEDTLRAGDGLCDEAAALRIVSEAPACIATLEERDGVRFDRTSQGAYDLGLEGGHSQRRILHCGDQTGALVIARLVERARQLPIEVFPQHTSVNLIADNSSGGPGTRTRIVGAYVLEETTGLIHTFCARQTVLATGGAGKVYRYTSNSGFATGDGIALAYRVGARVGNLEFFQFHPTLLFHEQLNNFLITEALRGEGARLELPGSGYQFLADYYPAEMELATRDKVARAIFTELERRSLSYLHLNASHLDPQLLQTKFPQISKTLRGLGIDISTDPIPIVPAAHYLCGGVLASPAGETDLEGLVAIGECAFTGLHGANRLASNSLIEGLVMGRLAALDSAISLDRN